MPHTPRPSPVWPRSAAVLLFSFLAALPASAQAPQAIASAPPLVAGGQVVPLDGSASGSSAGGDLQFAWTQVAGPAVSIQQADQATAHFTSPQADARLLFKLTVTDAQSGSASSEVEVRVDAPPAPKQFGKLATLTIAGGGGGKAEISAFHGPSKRLFTISSNGARLDVHDLSDPLNPVPVGQLTFGPSFVPNSVAVGGDLVAVALEAVPYMNPGELRLLDPVSLAPLGSAPAGALPDMVAISPDRRFVLLCNEGQPNLSNYAQNPPGSLTLVELAGQSISKVTQIAFSPFDAGKAAAAALGVRFDPNPAVSLSQDLEPEYATFSADSKRAFVGLQENNAVLVVDLEAAQPIGIFPLGRKDWSSSAMDQRAALTFYGFPPLPALGNTLAGQTLRLGGFSGLCYRGTSPAGRLRFLAVPDRGPVLAPLDVDGDGIAERPFALPEYQARLQPFELDPLTGVLELGAPIPLLQPDGVQPISGLPNLLASQPGLAFHDEEPVDVFGRALRLDPLGGDFAGVAVDAEGDFWLCDRYRPSVYEFGPDGVLKRRLVPAGSNDQPDGQGGTVQTGTDAVLPAIYAQRRFGRGFSGVAFDAARGRLALFLASPLDNPDVPGDASSQAARFGRILELDAGSGLPLAEFAYAFDQLGGSDRIGDAVWSGTAGRYLVLERNGSLGQDALRNLFQVDVAGATDLLNRSSLSGLSLLVELASEGLVQALGFAAVDKRLLANLSSAGYSAYPNAEGLALLPDGRLALLNDDGSGLFGASLDLASGKIALAPETAPTRLALVELAGVGLDPSDRDFAALIKSWPVYGLPQPDGLARFDAGGQSFLVTANEGDTREYGGNPAYVDEVRVGSGQYPLDPTAFPNASQLKDNVNLGRLKVSRVDGKLDGDADYDEIVAFGARSFTILSAQDGQQVYDSGALLEQLVLEIDPDLFNSEGTPADFDLRSDDKGPEPEGLAVGPIDGRPHLFLGMERPGHVFVFDLSLPNAPRFVGWMHSDDDFAPEGVEFIPADQSPSGRPIVAVSYEDSGTVVLWDLDL
jgi:hypothetical protein